MIVHSVRDPWMKVRPEVSAVDSLMHGSGAGGAPKKNWAARDTVLTALPVGNEGREIPLGATGISVGLMGRMTTGDVEAKTCTVNIWLYQDRGPAEFVASGTYTFGIQEVVEDPTLNPTATVTHNYADIVTITDQGWPLSKLAISPPDEVGSDDIALMIFSIYGSSWIKVEVSALSDAALRVIPIMKYSS